jgi:lantibiotic modifying enzyme
MAIALGEELCRAAARRDGVWTWDPEVAVGPGSASMPLTGLSHGAAGIALALLELHAATQRRHFLQAASGAFAYEDSLFNPSLGNWPDLRRIDVPGQSPQPPSYARAWCHGAPGIALARLRASALDPMRAQTHLSMARAALDTTLRAIDENVDRRGFDASLCHGLAGLMDIALTAGTILNETAFHERVVAAAAVLIERHHNLGDWPSGLVSGRPNPSLMLGHAGIGYFFLRLHDPKTVPSVLLLNT